VPAFFLPRKKITPAEGADSAKPVMLH